MEGYRRIEDRIAEIRDPVLVWFLDLRNEGDVCCLDCCRVSSALTCSRMEKGPADLILLVPDFLNLSDIAGLMQDGPLVLARSCDVVT